MRHTVDFLIFCSIFAITFAIALGVIAVNGSILLAVVVLFVMPSLLFAIWSDYDGKY